MMLLAAPPREICVLRLSAIGDVCHTLPVVRTLQAHFPHTRITWIIGRLEATLVGDIPGIEFITFDKRAGLAAWRALRAALRGRRFDVLLHMQVALRASFASLAVPASIRLGFDRARARDFQWLFTSHRIAARPAEHVMDGLFGFAEALGATRRVLRWDIPLAPADREFARVQTGEGRPVLVISPCSSMRARNFRNWRAERYAAVADHAAEKHGMRVILTGGPTELEREYGARIAAAMHTPPVNLIGLTTLKQLLAVLERATALIAPDSGPVHMATAVGTPVIGLYATSNPARTGPYFSRRWTVDRYAEALARFGGRRPDSVRWGARVRAAEAMDLITVSDVCERLDALMAAGAPRTGA
ncbi:MAG TPA: glycosyltransferase family 9 protein [Gammaproteobacteria bacterium]|nr:glycosyltransferase family 9 protein [Gammaproteobacteria bacterium]